MVGDCLINVEEGLEDLAATHAIVHTARGAACTSSRITLPSVVTVDLWPSTSAGMRKRAGIHSCASRGCLQKQAWMLTKNPQRIA